MSTVTTSHPRTATTPSAAPATTRARASASSSTTPVLSYTPKDLTTLLDQLRDKVFKHRDALRTLEQERLQLVDVVVEPDDIEAVETRLMEIENEKDWARKEVKRIIEWMDTVRLVLGKPKMAASWVGGKRRGVREAVEKARGYCRDG